MQNQTYSLEALNSPADKQEISRTWKRLFVVKTVQRLDHSAMLRISRGWLQHAQIPAGAGCRHVADDRCVVNIAATLVREADAQKDEALGQCCTLRQSE